MKFLISVRGDFAHLARLFTVMQVFLRIEISRTVLFLGDGWSSFRRCAGWRRIKPVLREQDRQEREKGVQKDGQVKANKSGRG